jgi:hypothetical protein
VVALAVHGGIGLGAPWPVLAGALAGAAAGAAMDARRQATAGPGGAGGRGP